MDKLLSADVRHNAPKDVNVLSVQVIGKCKHPYLDDILFNFVDVTTLLLLNNESSCSRCRVKEKKASGYIR